MEHKKGVASFCVLYLLGLTFMFYISLAVADYQEVALKPIADAAYDEKNGMQTYIVLVEKPVSQNLFAQSHEDLESWYQSFLPQTIASSNQLMNQRMVHAYRTVATGFAAKLTPEEVKEMEKKEGFVSAHPERILSLQTTHSPDFLGLHQGFGLWKATNYGQGVIIGLLDSGIGPDHPSFSDEGLPPPPARWKGKCDFNGTVCNNKLIGAKTFVGAGKGNTTGTPFDINGHGTHTSSTAAGNFVEGASVFGEANGTAVGMAPHAHLAMYKVCAGASCTEGDILAGFDAAVEDGVDIVSISLGGRSLPFHEDSIAIGAFAAIQKGIFVSCAGGNSGPSHGSLSNEAPWILTVGASTTDRILKSGDQIADVKNNTSSTLTPLAAILANGTVVGDALAPKVASFSSRGPNSASPGVLKPDIIGPGVSILAAWPRSVDNATQSKATFNIISGTSMATPHLSGIAALLKNSHPDWSPSAIKSAIMTTADVLNLAGLPIVDQNLRPADVFAIGAGHVNPAKANDPGLVYETQLEDYIPYFCGLNYTDKQIQSITQQTVDCSKVDVIPEAQLNYPSFSITVGSNETQYQSYTRTVKNVGPASSTYNLDLLVPHKMGMSVNPQVLTFTKTNQEITFQVQFIAQDGAGKDGVLISQGYLRWVSDKHNVTSPIAVVFDS